MCCGLVASADSAVEAGAPAKRSKFTSRIRAVGGEFDLCRHDICVQDDDRPSKAGGRAGKVVVLCNDDDSYYAQYFESAASLDEFIRSAIQCREEVLGSLTSTNKIVHFYPKIE